jgi:hypothetical protein
VTADVADHHLAEVGADQGRNRKVLLRDLAASPRPPIFELTLDHLFKGLDALL